MHVYVIMYVCMYAFQGLPFPFIHVSFLRFVLTNNILEIKLFFTEQEIRFPALGFTLGKSKLVVTMFQNFC